MIFELNKVLIEFLFKTVNQIHKDISAHKSYLINGWALLLLLRRYFKRLRTAIDSYFEEYYYSTGLIVM